MILTYSNPGQIEKDNVNKEARCRARVYLDILDIGSRPEPDYISAMDDSQDEDVENNSFET